MTLSREEAAEALREIQATGLRSTQRQTYRAAARHLLLWGFLWAVGYCATALWPPYADAIWVGIVVGWALLALLIPPQRRRTASTATDDQGRKNLNRIVASLGAGAMLVVGTAVIMHAGGREIGAYVPLVVGVAYIAAGLWGAGPRYAAIGTALCALTLCAYLLVPAYFLWLLAAGGSVTFVLTGLWLRSA